MQKHNMWLRKALLHYLFEGKMVSLRTCS